MKLKKLFSILLVVTMSIFAFAGCSTVHAPKLPKDTVWEDANTAMSKIEVGWNLGNTFDCYDSDKEYMEETYDYFETLWGNPVTTREIITTVKNGGFSAVRMPVTWVNHIDSENKIDDAWMDRVEEVVNYVLDEDLYCIINVHHDTGEKGWLRASYSDWETKSARYQSIWEQVALRFNKYGEKLLFENYNELLDDSSKWWEPKSNKGYMAANELNQIFTSTVRGTGGNNLHRNLILCTYATSCSSKVADNFILPNDIYANHFIIETHCYDPVAFTTKNESDPAQNSKWKSSFDGKVKKGLKMSAELGKKLGVPVIIGEFGSQNADNDSAASEYVKCFMKYAHEYGLTPFYWDDGGNYRLLNRRTLEWEKGGYREAMFSK